MRIVVYRFAGLFTKVKISVMFYSRLSLKCRPLSYHCFLLSVTRYSGCFVVALSLATYLNPNEVALFYILIVVSIVSSFLSFSRSESCLWYAFVLVPVACLMERLSALVLLPMAWLMLLNVHGPRLVIFTWHRAR